MHLVVKYLIDALYVLIAATVIIILTKKGFFESIFRFGRYIAAAVVAYCVGPIVSQFISSKWIYPGIFNVVSEKLRTFLEATAGALDLTAIIDALPFLVKRFIDPAALEAKYGATVENFGVIADDFAASVATPISNVLSNLIAYVGVYFVALLVLWLVFKILNGVVKNSGLKWINGLLGALLGVVTAVILLAVFTWILSFILGMIGFDTPFAQWVGESYLYRFFWEREIFGFLN